MMEEVFFKWALFFFVVVDGLIVAIIADYRKLSGGVVPWFIAGLFFPLIAIVVALIVKPNAEALNAHQIALGEAKKCPVCAEVVRFEALKCRFCAHEFSRQGQGSSAKGWRTDNSGAWNNVKAKRLCIACSKPLAPTAERCSHCGYEMRRQA